VCAGTIGSRLLHHAAAQTRSAAAAGQEQFNTTTNLLAATQEQLSALRAEVREKKKRLWAAARYAQMSPELLAFLEGKDPAKMPLNFWAELRSELGLGWDASPNYVLVKKEVVKALDYSRFYWAESLSDTACDLLALSPGEKAALSAVVIQTRDEWAELHLQRTQPSGDILAQYSVSPADPVLDQSVSNRFAVSITDTLGSERSELLLSKAWRQLMGKIGPSATETMIIRRTVINGEPDLMCEVSRGNEFRSATIRDCRYPISWIALLPGGGQGSWKALAQREGFELPKNFYGP
jgi:hypothetical protein